MRLLALGFAVQAAHSDVARSAAKMQDALQGMF